MKLASKILGALLMIITHHFSYADVYKCQIGAKTIYQTDPCEAKSAQQKIIRVRPMTDEETAQAQDRLNAWKVQQLREEAQKKADADQQQLTRERQESLNLQRRSVAAQEREAAAADRSSRTSNAGLGGRQPYYYDSQYDYPYAKPSKHSRHRNYPKRASEDSRVYSPEITSGISSNRKAQVSAKGRPSFGTSP